MEARLNELAIVAVIGTLILLVWRGQPLQLATPSERRETVRNPRFWLGVVVFCLWLQVLQTIARR